MKTILFKLVAYVTIMKKKKTKKYWPTTTQFLIDAPIVCPLLLNYRTLPEAEMIYCFLIVATRYSPAAGCIAVIIVNILEVTPGNMLGKIRPLTFTSSDCTFLPARRPKRGHHRLRYRYTLDCAVTKPPEIKMIDHQDQNQMVTCCWWHVTEVFCRSPLPMIYDPEEII